MLEVAFNKKRNHGRKILCLGAHCDDIEIGCGGTLLTILKKSDDYDVRWIVFSSNPMREREAISSANVFLNAARKKKIEIGNFRDGFFPYIGGEIKERFERLKEEYSPDLIFTHYRNDLHQDHRVISDLTWNTFRNHFILEYEIIKYDGDLGRPNLFVPIESSVCKKKTSAIIKYFKTQGEKHWLKEDLLLSILRIRGMECVSYSDYAEAFYVRKCLLEI